MEQKGLSKDLCENMRINTAVKMVGLFGDPTTAASAAKLVQLNTDDLQRLGNGRYAIKSDQKPPIIVQVRGDRLGHSNSMSAVEWQAVAAHQLQEYYRSPMSFDPVPEAVGKPQTPPPTPSEQEPSEEHQTPSPAPQNVAVSDGTTKTDTPPPKPAKPTKPQRKPKFGTN